MTEKSEANDSQQDEHLTSGWEEDVPVDDTVMRQFVLNLIDATRAAVLDLGGDVLDTPQFFAADVRRPATFFNTAVVRQPLFEESVKTFVPILNQWCSAGTGMMLLLSPWPTPDLRSHGWTLMGHPPVHLRPTGGAIPEDPPGIDIKPVTDFASLLHWEGVLIEGFPLDEMRDLPAGSLVAERMLSHSSCRRWVAYCNDKPVGAVLAHVSHGINQVALVATLQEARRAGIGESLTWRATMADRSLPAMLMSSDEGRSVYQRMGYLPLTRFTLWYRLR